MNAVSDVCVFTTAELGLERLAAVRCLLEVAFEGDFSDEDWDHALGGWHVLVTADDGALVAHTAVVPRRLYVADRHFRSGYVEAVGTAPSRQGTGVGSLAMEAIGELLPRHFELGALATGRWSFYERLGWERWRGPTFARDGDEVLRTAEDDDAVMVLRFGPSADIELTAALTCEARQGDDW